MDMFSDRREPVYNSREPREMAAYRQQVRQAATLRGETGRQEERGSLPQESVGRPSLAFQVEPKVRRNHRQLLRWEKALVYTGTES